MASQGVRIFQRSSLKLFRRNISSSTTCRALDPTKKMNVARHSFAAISLRPFSKQSVRHRTTGANVHSPLNNDGDSNYANRPPKETILLDGCDYEHWLIVMEFPKEPKPSEDEMINSYVKTLASIVGSEEEAKKKIYSVSTHTYTGFGALISEELSYKVKSLPGVLWVLPDSYIDVPNKDYGGDLFIDGKVIPRPQYRYPERHPGRNDRPRRNNRQFEQRRPPMQPNQMGGQPPNPAGQPPNPAGAQHHNLAGGWQQNQFRGAQPNQMDGMQQNRPGGWQQNQPGGMPPMNQPGGMPSSQSPMQQKPNQIDGMQQNRPGGWQQNQPGGMPPMNQPGGMPSSQPPMQQYQQGGWQPNHNSAPSATEEPSHPNMAEASQFGNNQGSQ